MRFILHYASKGLDGRSSEVSIPVKADSKKTIKTILRDAAEQAACLEALQFDAFGTQHYTHNFVQSVSEGRLNYLRERAATNNKRPPASFNIQGCNYVHSPVKVFTVDEWFDACQATARANQECSQPA